MLEFRHLQWTIICCRWQTEPVFDEAVFSRLVSEVHATNLWKRNVRFIHDDKEFLRVTMELSSACCKEIQETVRPFARLSSIEMQGIILNGLTMPNFTKHFQIVLRSLLKAMTLNEFVLVIELRQSKLEFILDAFERLLEAFLTGHEEFFRMNPSLIEVVKDFPRNRVTDLHVRNAIKIEANAQRIVSRRHPDIKNFSSKPTFTS